MGSSLNKGVVVGLAVAAIVICGLVAYIVFGAPGQSHMDPNTAKSYADHVKESQQSMGYPGGPTAGHSAQSGSSGYHGSSGSQYPGSSSYPGGSGGPH
ncbi:MAG TPA: hypothetical protein VKT77_20590 [Chthonomonadaceae bacterium]|nr:hypothetical protein [Chthonomonadaceae bacterium]